MIQDEQTTKDEINIPQVDEFPADSSEIAFEPKNNPYDLTAVDMAEFSKDKHKQSELFSKIKKLPPPLQNIFINSDTTFVMMEAKNNFNLTEEQSSQLSKIIREILLLNAPFGGVINSAAEKLKIEKEKSKEIINFILSNILNQDGFGTLKRMNAEKFGKPVKKPAIPPKKDPPEPPAEPQKENVQNLVNLREGEQNNNDQ